MAFVIKAVIKAVIWMFFCYVFAAMLGVELTTPVFALAVLTSLVENIVVTVTIKD